MNKKISVLFAMAAVASALCLSACGGDKNEPSASSTIASAASTAAAAQSLEPATSKESDSRDQRTDNGDGIPKDGDMYKGKKVGSVEKVPDCDDDKHGVIYIYDEDDELIEAIKY